MLGNVRPTGSRDDPAHLRGLYAVLATKLSLGNTPGSMHQADGHDVCLTQNRTSILFSRVWAVYLSAPLHHVVDVILLRASVQMVRVAARGIVAGMQDIKALWNGAFGESVGDPVRKQIARFPRGSAIPRWVGGPHPWPAFVGTALINPTPKVGCELIGSSGCPRHDGNCYPLINARQ